MHNARLAALAMLTVASTFASRPASAVDRSMISTATAANTCTPALPAYEGLVRKRPLAVQNEGAAGAFITCSLAAGNAIVSASLFASSNDGQVHTMTCTAVLGFAGGTPLYVTRTMTLPANGNLGLVTLNPVDVGSSSGDLNTLNLSYSCLVMPGTGINGSYMSWSQDVGA